MGVYVVTEYCHNGVTPRWRVFGPPELRRAVVSAQ